jgi:hypothetical protein
MGKWVLAQLDPIKLNLIGLLIGYLQKAQTGQKKKKKKRTRKNNPSRPNQKGRKNTLARI